VSCDQFSQQICFMHAIGVFFFSIPQRFGAVCVRACMCVCVCVCVCVCDMSLSLFIQISVGCAPCL
jgi:hypothetical protein